MKHFVNSQSQNIPIHRRDAVELPVFGMLLNNLIRLVAMFERPANQRLGVPRKPSGSSAAFRLVRKCPTVSIAPLGGYMLAKSGFLEHYDFMHFRTFLLIVIGLLFIEQNGRAQGREYNRRLLYVATP